MPEVETSTSPDTPTPSGPYGHAARVGDGVRIVGTADVDLTAVTRT